MIEKLRIFLISTDFLACAMGYLEKIECPILLKSYEPKRLNKIVADYNRTAFQCIQNNYSLEATR